MTVRANIRPVDLIDNEEINVVTLERLERRLSEVSGEVRVDIANLRTEMVDRSASLLKWLLMFFVAQTAALGTLMALFR
jgi:hypothetical protein